MILELATSNVSSAQNGGSNSAQRAATGQKGGWCPGWPGDATYESQSTLSISLKKDLAAVLVQEPLSGLAVIVPYLPDLGLRYFLTPGVLAKATRSRLPLSFGVPPIASPQAAVKAAVVAHIKGLK